jgi:hypothetical protein
MMGALSDAHIKRITSGQDSAALKASHVKRSEDTAGLALFTTLFVRLWKELHTKVFCYDATSIRYSMETAHCFAGKTPTDDSQDGPCMCNQSDTRECVQP